MLHAERRPRCFSGDALHEVTQLADKSFIIEADLPERFNQRTLLEQLVAERPAELGKLTWARGDQVTPRYTKAYDRDYTFSSTTHEANTLPAFLQPLMDWANEPEQLRLFWGLEEGAPKKLLAVFNGALVNWYLTGAHYIGAHSDEVKDLVHGSPIFSASFGQARTLVLRRKTGGARDEVCKCALPHCSYVVMGGDCQREYTHEVPLVTGAEGAAMTARVNVTFRCFKGGSSKLC